MTQIIGNRPKNERGDYFTIHEIAESLGCKVNSIYKKIIFDNEAPKPIYKNLRPYYKFEDVKKFLEK